MLVIRDAQMRQLAKLRQEAFEVVVVEYLASHLHHNDRMASRQLAAEALVRAPAFGLEAERDLVRFALITGGLFGVPPYPELPVQALANLLAYGLPPATKLDQYEAWARGQTPFPVLDMTSFSELPPGATVMPCGPAQHRSLHWIEIQLVGDDESPVPWERYTVRLPDGRLVPGYLDENGFARLAGLEQPGECEVCFPDLDHEAWQRLGGP